MQIRQIFQYDVIKTLQLLNTYMTLEEGIDFLYFLKKTYAITYKQISVLYKQGTLIDLYHVYLYEQQYLKRDQ